MTSRETRRSGPDHRGHRHRREAPDCCRRGHARRDHLTDLAEALTDLAEALTSLADCAQATGDPDAAERHLAEVIAIAAPRALIPAQATALAGRARLRAAQATATGATPMCWHRAVTTPGFEWLA